MNELTHRYKVWLMLEADTPLSIGSGKEGLTTDRLVARNAAGLPYLPGTGLAGALRNALSDLPTAIDVDDIFGYAKGNKGLGSRLIVNSAHLLSSDGNSVLEGVPVIEETNPYYQLLQSLPLRDHARHNERGTAADKGKFDEQVCFKGVRFLGSLELLGTLCDSNAWGDILQQFADPFFRIGGGTRKGFGKLKLVKIFEKVYDLTNKESRTAYLNDDNSLSLPKDGTWQNVELTTLPSEAYTKYELKITPRDFFIFGAGYGDDEADTVYKKEQKVVWDEYTGTATLTEQKILIPATSVKGALRHRLAFHYNIEIENYIDDNDVLSLLDERIKELEKLAVVPEGIAHDDGWWEKAMKRIEEATFDEKESAKGETDDTSQNAAVKAIFGYAADESGNTNNNGQKGRILISDLYLEPAKEKVFDHVRIDRFTGGASDGALFQEKTVANTGEFTIEILVENIAFQDEKIKAAWHAALLDVCEGRLPLGGKTTKGHGFFSGTCNIDLKPANT